MPLTAAARRRLYSSVTKKRYSPRSCSRSSKSRRTPVEYPMIRTAAKNDRIRQVGCRRCRLDDANEVAAGDADPCRGDGSVDRCCIHAASSCNHNVVENADKCGGCHPSFLNALSIYGITYLQIALTSALYPNSKNLLHRLICLH